jgi:hypothetical protein
LKNSSVLDHASFAATQPRAEAPKFYAIVNFVETTPCWWDGCIRWP